MADFAPPPGPPPPKVPEGWKAVWNAQYNEWFYVNTHTKQSQWDKPTEPVYGGDAPPGGAPPGYDSSSARNTGPEKGGYHQDNNPYHQDPGQGSSMSDEALARKMQDEENARSRGASDGLYGQQQNASPYGQQAPQYGGSPYGQQQQSLPPREEKSRGLFGKISSKLGGGGSSSRPVGYGQQGGYPQQQYGGGYGGGYPPQQQPYGYGGGGYPPQQQYYGGQPQRRQGGGMGAGGGALLGAGAGLVGGALLMDAMDDNEQDAYQEGYDDGGGGDDGGDGGDDGGD